MSKIDYPTRAAHRVALYRGADHIVGQELEIIREEFDEAMASAPAWHARPTSPGWWVCVTEDDDPFRPTVLELNDDDLKRGAPFRTTWVSIPEPPEMPTDGTNLEH